MKQLQSPTFINPFFIRSLPATGVVTDGAVKVGSELLQFTDTPYSNGTEVNVYLSQNFYCETTAEIEAKRQVQEEQQRQRQQAALEAEQRRADEAKRFNDSLNIPARWTPEIKRVLSGLSETSAGNGCYKNTVAHVYLLEDLNEGRLNREAGNFLCTTDKGYLSDSLDYQDEYATKVTCKKCLEIAKRWQS